jgi:hypothetical protein
MGETMGADAAGLPGGEGSRLGEMLYGAARGAVGAMAMTGMRVLTTELGLLEQTPAGRRAPARAARGRCCGARRASSAEV